MRPPGTFEPVPAPKQLPVLGVVLLLSWMAAAQSNPPGQLDPLLQLMVTQPSIEVATNVQATAVFDPPVVRPGQKSTYRVTFNALNDSVKWPDTVPFPPPLQSRFSARGQSLLPVENRLRPQTTINHQVRAPNPGGYTVPEYPVTVYGRPVRVPAARLEVSEQAVATWAPELELEFARTNLYLGQAVGTRVLLRASPANAIQAIADLRFNGTGFFMDPRATRQAVMMLPHQGREVATYVYDTTLTPLVAGPLTVSAQGVTVGNRFTGPISIQGQVTIAGGVPQFLLIDSEPATLTVRPLPRSGELPGFTGAIGNLRLDPLQLSTNRLRAGEFLKLTVTFRGGDNLARLVPPPPPRARDWQVFAAVPGNAPATPPPALPGSAAVFTYTLIPLSATVSNTPPIPFSYFDPVQGRHVDLTVPSRPVTVLPGGMAVDAAALAALNREAGGAEARLRFSDLTDDPGRTSASLAPLQQRGWFLLVQTVPVAGFLALWQWDRRRRFLQAHPEILLRRRARRALHRQRRRLHRAARDRDAAGFAALAVEAMRVAVAPHFPAEPRALVCRDVLQVLGGASPARATVKRFFAATDAAQFSGGTGGEESLLDQQSGLDAVLLELEARL